MTQGQGGGPNIPACGSFHFSTQEAPTDLQEEIMIFRFRHFPVLTSQGVPTDLLDRPDDFSLQTLLSLLTHMLRKRKNIFETI